MPIAPRSRPQPLPATTLPAVPGLSMPPLPIPQPGAAPTGQGMGQSGTQPDRQRLLQALMRGR